MSTSCPKLRPSSLSVLVLQLPHEHLEHPPRSNDTVLDLLSVLPLYPKRFFQRLNLSVGQMQLLLVGLTAFLVNLALSIRVGFPLLAFPTLDVSCWRGIEAS